ncbi:MAG: TolC family protein [Pseudomonadota bacterium]
MRRFLTLASGLLLCACATTRAPYVPPQTPVADRAFTVDAGVAPRPDAPAHDWWRTLGDDALEAMVGRAFENNPGLRGALARVRAARAARTLQATASRPTGALSANIDYGQPALGGGPIQVDVDPQMVIGLGGSALWELDLFGRLDALERAAEADLSARIWDRRDAQALLAAEVARAWLDLRTAESALALTEENLRIQSGLVDLTQIRFEEGFATQLDQALATSQLRTTRALQPPLRADREAALNRLATLTALPVADVAETVGAGWLPNALPDTLPLGDVSGLLRRRADVRAAERTIAAAFARADAVHSDFFPRVSLVGDTALVGTSLDRLTGPNAFGFGVGPSLSWEGLDRPRVQARLDAAEAETDLAVALYEEAVLLALEETQSQFVRFARQNERLAELARAAQDTRTAVTLSRIRYEEGEDDLLVVLDAESRLLQVDQARLDARRASLAAAINVYQALGAGWQE